jgi:hypothetical protein
MAERQDSHITGKKNAPMLPRVPNPGPIPMHTRAKMGARDLQENPFGQGAVPKTNMVANGQRKTW